MLNSKLKLQGLPLDEIIHEGVFGNNPEVSIDDWKYIEHLYQEDVGGRLKREYYKGYRDGENHAWATLLEED